MEVKNKNVSIAVLSGKKVPDIAVCMCIDFKCDWHSLKLLKNNTQCESKSEMNKGAEAAALASALFDNIREKMVGSPLEASKSRVSSMCCNYQNGKFLVCWNTQGSVSTMRRTITYALASLTPAKVFSKYSKNIKMLGGRPSREEFNHCANLMSAGIKKNVHFVVVGKIKLDQPKLKDMLNKVQGKLAGQVVFPAKDTSSPAATNVPTHAYPTVKSDGLGAAVVADYIRNRSNGMPVDINCGTVVVYDHSWESKSRALKAPAKIKDFVKKKYEKLGAEFPCVMAYFLITQGMSDCSALNKLLKSKPSGSSMADLIKKAL